LITFEAIGIASATGIEETVAMLRFSVEMPPELIALASAVVGRHVAPLFSGNLIFDVQCLVFINFEVDVFCDLCEHVVLYDLK
jgi:hypothetical protein